MSLILVVAALAIVVFLLLASLGRKAGKPGGSVGMPYLAAAALFSPAERSFLGVLDQALGSDYRIFGKVRVADVASLKPGLGQSARQGALNRISGKHLDFVVCRSADLSIACAIELNDKSHGSQRARERDEFVVSLCQTIGLPLVQVPAKAGYQIDEVRNQVLAAISPSTNSQLG